MPFVETTCGTFNTEGLLTVSKSNAIAQVPFGGWAIILRYQRRNDDLVFQCADEAQADECLATINTALNNLNAPLGGPIMG